MEHTPPAPPEPSRAASPGPSPGTPREATPGTPPGTPPGISLRTARRGDADRVLAFWRLAAKGRSVSDDVDGVTALIARDPEALLLAERDGELVGTVIAGFDGWRCHLYRLAVHPGHRRQGVGAALLAAAERRFTALGGRRADAMVLDANEEGGATWEATGYRRQPEWTRWTKPL